MADELRFENCVIQVKSESGLVSLDDLWVAANDSTAMQPIAWLAQDVTQAHMKKFASDLNLPAKRSKYTPQCGRTTEFIVEIPSVIEVVEGRLFAAPEVAIFYLRRSSSDLYKWALDELSAVQPAPEVVSPAVEEYWRRYRRGETGSAHIDLGTHHFDMIVPFPPHHGDHTDHGDSNDPTGA